MKQETIKIYSGDTGNMPQRLELEMSGKGRVSGKYQETDLDLWRRQSPARLTALLLGSCVSCRGRDITEPPFPHP